MGAAQQSFRVGAWDGTGSRFLAWPEYGRELSTTLYKSNGWPVRVVMHIREQGKTRGGSVVELFLSFCHV